jgi:hypothetical protein
MICYSMYCKLFYQFCFVKKSTIIGIFCKFDSIDIKYIVFNIKLANLYDK